MFIGDNEAIGLVQGDRFIETRHGQIAIHDKYSDSGSLGKKSIFRWLFENLVNIFGFGK